MRPMVILYLAAASLALQLAAFAVELAGLIVRRRHRKRSKK
jgi:hypothetical protein